MLYYFGLKTRRVPKRINKYVVSLMAVILAVTLYLSSPGGCKIYAYGQNDFCWKYSLNIINTGFPASLTPISFDNVDTELWENNTYIDSFGWSIYNFQGSESDSYDVMLQDFPSTSSNIWYVIPVVNYGAENEVTTLMGADDIQRNQATYFYIEDLYQIPNHNDFNETVFNIKLEIADPLITTTTILPHTSTLLEKYNDVSSEGFKLLYIDYGSYAIVKGIVDEDYIELAVTPDPGENIPIEFSLNSSNELNLSVFEVAATTEPGVVLTTNTRDLYLGVDYETGVYSNYANRLFMRVAEFVFDGDLVAYYGFNSIDMFETENLSPYYSGHVEDLSSNSHDASYFFDRPQYDYTVSASAIVPSSSAGSTIFTSGVSNILGNWYGSSNPGELGTTNSNFIGLSFLTPPADLGLPDQAWYTLWFSAFGIVLALGLFWASNSVPLSLLGASTPLILGTMQGLVNSWFVVVWFLLFFGIYSTYQWIERA